MRTICFFFILIFLLSCKEKKQVELEINFYSLDTITNLKSLTLTQFRGDQKPKNLTFYNIDCSSPNKFILNLADTGTYLGLLEIKKDGGQFHITIDSIRIKSGHNIINKELNLGHMSIPQQ